MVTDMNLSISNIAWSAENDRLVYSIMKEHGFAGLEIAPTRIFPESPYDRLDEASKWAVDLKQEYGFVIPSMQSIWYGKSEKLFGTDDERKELVRYTKKAIDFAETIGCRNLVFGCPRNRNMPENADLSTAISFFKEIGDYALLHNTVIGMEANPPIYNTNFINDTKSALDLICEVGSEGFKLNLDVGTMIANEEDVSVLSGREDLINHVHISEPMLKPVEERKLHNDLASLLVSNDYLGFVSIETGKQDDISLVGSMIDYISQIF